MKLESAGVSPNGMLIDSQGRAYVFAATEKEDRHINQLEGKVWSVPFALTTTANDAYVQYIKNTGTKNLHVTDYRATNTGVASVVTIEHVSGVAANTTIITPVSRNLGSPAVMSADNFVGATGAGITGLTAEGVLFPKMSKANDEVHLSTSSNIIIPPGKALAVKYATTGAIIVGSLSVVEVQPESRT